MPSSHRPSRNFDPQRAIAGRNLAWDPSLHLDGFETDPVARDRDQKLVRPLQAIGRHDLADDLQRAFERDEMPPAWSNVGYRPLRRWLTNEGATLAHAGNDKASGRFGVVASIVPSGLTAPIGSLSAITPRQVVKLMWDGFERVEYGSCRILGGVDVSFNELAGANQKPGHYQVHAGVAILGHPSDERSRELLCASIKGAFDLESTAPIPLQVKELRDPVEQLSYLMKRLFTRRVSIIDKRRRRNTLDCPLKPAQAAEVAAWLSQFPQTDRLILKGLRRYGDRIVPTAPRRRQEDGE